VTPRRLLASAALAVALIVAGCSSSSAEVDLSAPTSTRPRADAPVTTDLGAPPVAVVLGDSNIFASAPELNDALSQAGFTPDVRGISGSGLKDNATDWLPAAAVVKAAQPAVVVIALGTNDEINAIDATTFAGRADELLAALGPLPVVWVTHSENGVVHPIEYEQQVNEAIRALPATHPNVTVLDLAPQIAGTPDVLGSDHLHYEGDGREWFAERIATAAEAASEGAATP
jgi:lysophospholipase L1-like esterase